MCNLTVKQTWFVLLACFAFVNTEVTIENGGYSVLVSFSQNVKSTEGLELLEKMKESLQNASSILYNTIGLQFTKVMFEIPESWNTLEINIDSSSVPKYAKSDFLIDDTNDVIFGKFPFAQQYGGCGIPGHQITIPTAFFSEVNKFPRGTALAREWLKYRYGVFDENGYKKDPIYPLYRLFPQDENSKLSVTDCTNNPVAYDLKGEGEAFSENDQPFNPSPLSKVVPDATTLGNVTSSIMYFHQDIPDLLHICGKDSDHPHNALSPNKHNAMCRSQSIWEVVRKSGDFRTGSASKKYSDIEFIYAQERRMKVVVAWENTLNVGKIKGEIICNAIKRFAYELPQGTKFNGFPFSGTLSSEKDYTLRKLNDLKDKNDIIADIMSDFVKVSNGNITLAVLKALEILSSDSSNSEPEGTIIVISKSGEGISNTLSETIEKFDVCVKVLSLSEGGTFHQAEYYNLASPCGFPEDITTDNNEELFNQLFASMEAVLPATVDDKITKTVKTGYLSKNDSITLQVDEAVEKVTFWIFTKREVENFEMKFNEKNEKLQPLKTTTDIMAFSFSPREAGKIEIAYRYQTDPIFTQVRATLKAGKYLNGFVYIHDTTTEKSTHQMPVILYAVIRYGAYPVQNAKVIATIERPKESATVLQMLDDGRGDPDITGNDGVYSRYFTQFNEKGVYTVNVKVQITDLTFYGVNENADYQTCCGSVLETASSQIPVSSKDFKTFFIAKSKRPDTGYKPSRITDLRIGDILDDKIVLKWSAPGEEGDSGTVHSYEIKLYTSHEDAVKGLNGIILNNTVNPSESGATQTLELAFSSFKEPGRYYITLSAKNERESGEASPILEIFVPDKQTTTATPENETGDDGSAKTAGSEKRKALIIGLVVGVILLLILIVLVVYFIVVKPKRKEAKAEPTSSNEAERADNHVISPISFVSADTLIRHHNEKKLARMKNKEPPIFREEDFDDTESSQTQESPDNNNTQQPEDSDRARDNEERLPPKSPKKTTYV